MEMNRRNFIKTGLAVAGSLALPKTAKTQDETKINVYVRPNINRDTPYGDVDWNTLTDEQTRTDLMNDVLRLGEVNKITYNKPNWVCHHYSILDVLKIYGYKKENPEYPDIPQVFFDKGLTQEQIGEFNLPLYYIAIESSQLESGGHALVGALTGNENNGDLRIWDNWKLWEPQNNNLMYIGWPLLPKNSDVFICSIKRFFSNSDRQFIPTNLIKFQITNGTPEVTSHINPNLILERPPIEPTAVVEQTPAQFTLSQNYPNPFNANTIIEYSLNEPGSVNLEIYNISGQRLETLVNESQSAGTHIARWKADNYSSGIYLYQLRVGNNVEKKKMSLVK